MFSGFFPARLAFVFGCRLLSSTKADILFRKPSRRGITEPLEIAKPLERKMKWDMEWKDGAFFCSTDYVTVNVPEGTCPTMLTFLVVYVWSWAYSFEAWNSGSNSRWTHSSGPRNIGGVGFWFIFGSCFFVNTSGRTVQHTNVEDCGFGTVLYVIERLASRSYGRHFAFPVAISSQSMRCSTLDFAVKTNCN